MCAIVDDPRLRQRNGYFFVRGHSSIHAISLDAMNTKWVCLVYNGQDNPDLLAVILMLMDC